VQIGNASGSLTSVANGTTGQVLTATTGQTDLAKCYRRIDYSRWDSGSATGSTLTISGGTTGLTTTASGTTVDLTGTLDVANGGTGTLHSPPTL